MNITEMVNKANIVPDKLAGFTSGLAGRLSSIINAFSIIILLIAFFVIELVDGYLAGMPVETNC